jgi:hypothetical protein
MPRVLLATNTETSCLMNASKTTTLSRTDSSVTRGTAGCDMVVAVAYTSEEAMDDESDACAAFMTRLFRFNVLYGDAKTAGPPWRGLSSNTLAPTRRSSSVGVLV